MKGSECSLHQQQPKLVIGGKGLLGCGREADTILLRTPVLLWAVSQKYQGETQFSSGPGNHTGWWEQSAGNAPLSLHKDEFILYFWNLASPPRTVLTSQKGETSLDLPPAWQFLTHLPTDCHQCPSKRGASELKSPSVASETPCTAESCPLQQRCWETHPFQPLFYFLVAVRVRAEFCGPFLQCWMSDQHYSQNRKLPAGSFYGCTGIYASIHMYKTKIQLLDCTKYIKPIKALTQDK